MEVETDDIEISITTCYVLMRELVILEMKILTMPATQFLY